MRNLLAQAAMRLLGATFIALSLTLASCSGRTPEPERQPLGGDPPGTAAKLSLGSANQPLEGGQFANAINCAAAIQITRALIEQMSLAKETQELTMLQQAGNVYRRRAEQLARPSDRNGVAASIHRAVLENGQEGSQQAQLAISCVRSLATEDAS